MTGNTTSNEPILTRWARFAARYPGRIFLVALAITIVMGVGMSMLAMEMNFYSIMPQSSSQVRDLKQIIEEFPFASAITVVVDGRNLPPTESKAAVKATIDEMYDTFTADEYSSAIDGVYGRMETDFFARHGFMITKPKDLERMRDLYANPDLVPFFTALNDDLEREYSGDGEALEADENQVVSWVGGIEKILDELDGSLGAAAGAGSSAAIEGSIEAALDAYLIGDPYYLSRNEDMGILMIQPTYTINDLGPLVHETTRIENRVNEIAAANGLTAGLTGLLVVGRDEMVTSEQGFGLSMLIAIVLILALMIAAFRIRSAPFIIGIPLVLGVLWTMGLTGFALRRLNIMTAMYMVALVGLGVDYAIHLMTGFVQERDRGRSFEDAIAESFARNARGIITGGLTSAAAFFALLLAESAMLRELAVVAGLGIISELVAMLLLVPAILSWRNRRIERKGKPDPMLNRKAFIRPEFADGIGRAITARPGTWAAVLLLVGLAIGTQAFHVRIQDNLMEMEAKGLSSVELQDVMTDEFGAAPDVLTIISSNRDELPPLVDQLDDLDTVKMVDAITNWWPTDAQTGERLPYIEEIRSALESWSPGDDPDPELLIQELYRLEANLIEMGDMAVLGGTDRVAFALNRATGLNIDGEKVAESVFDRLFDHLGSPELNDAALSSYQRAFSTLLRDRVYRMATADPITENDLPPQIRDAFTSRDGTTTLVTISPRQNPWNGEYRTIFTSQVETVTDRGTGMILAADQLISIAESDGTRGLIAALIAVFVILLIDFRNITITLLSFIPLTLAFATLIGLMAIFGIEFDFVNIIAIPLLVGIGIDVSVHINHRYLHEGAGEMHTAIARTGSAVTLTTITTMIGFMSFIPSIMRAMRSTGIVLTLAMALAFIYSILFHPAVLVLTSERWGWNLKDRIKKENTNDDAE